MKRTFASLYLFAILGMPSHAQGTNTHVQQITYNQVDTISLTMVIYYPPDMEQEEIYPAMIYFFGGGTDIARIDARSSMYVADKQSKVFR